MHFRSRIGALAVLLLATLAGCQFYSFVSLPGDLGIGEVRIEPVLLGAPDTDASRSTPVLVAVHGFGASAYETGYLADYLTRRGYLVSRPNLGKHGNASLEDFGSSTWREWEEPIANEYARLAGLGYKNVQFLTISTGGTVVMELFSRGQLNPPPNRISMVAPLLDFADKLSGGLGILQALGAKNKPNQSTGSSKGRFYSDWPAPAVRQLIDLTEVMKGRLRGTIQISGDTRIQIFQSMGDRTVDPLSAGLWANGIKGGLVAVHLMDSDVHVPIGPDKIDETGKNVTKPETQSLRDRILEQVALAHRVP